MQIKLKVWFELDGEYIFGDGRAELLRLIDQLGSIAKAASTIKMSYRHAWGQIRRLEERLGIKLVETRTGGRGGGETNLTDVAKEFLSRYGKFRSGLDMLARDKCKENFCHIYFS
jgi:molybdate transport system regulatory protein